MSPKSPNSETETPAEQPKYTLDDLLDGITPDNIHDEIDSGDPVGNEAW